MIAQQDPEAQKILDAFSKKTKSYKAYNAQFEIVYENKQNGESTENKGNITIMGNKYKMNINQTDIYFDGKNTYNYSSKSNEVSISSPKKKDEESFFNNPSRLFNLYTKEFKFRLLGEIVYKSRVCYEIDLFPKDLNKKYSIIKLLIDIENLELISAKLIMKSGVNYTLNILKFTANIAANEKDFNFDSSKYKGIEIIDLR